jgi:hypothetical protein
MRKDCLHVGLLGLKSEERAANVARMWLQIQKNRSAPSADIADTAPEARFVPERLAAYRPHSRWRSVKTTDLAGAARVNAALGSQGGDYTISWSGRRALFRRLYGVKLAVALLHAPSPLVAGNRDTDMVWASSFACGGDFLLRIAGCQGKDLIAEAGSAALAARGFSGCTAPAPA